MKPIAISLGRCLLAVGTCLSILVVVEAHQKMVEASSLSTVSANALRSGRFALRAQTPAGGTPYLFRSPVILPTASPSATVSAPSATVSAPSTAAASAKPQAEPDNAPKLAISAGAPGAQAKDIAPANVAQVATNSWSGVSFPVEQFQAYTSPFGYRRSIEGYSSNEFHYGLDMAAPKGSYLRNWSSGTVVEVTDDSNCGTSVVVEAGNWLSIFCHMEGRVESSGGKRYMIDRDGGLQIFEGQQVYAGQRVGRVGMSGRTTGPHLHWGLKYDNNWVDPALVLRAMYTSQPTAAIPQQARQQVAVNPNSTPQE